MQRCLGSGGRNGLILPSPVVGVLEAEPEGGTGPAQSFKREGEPAGNRGTTLEDTLESGAGDTEQARGVTGAELAAEEVVPDGLARVRGIAPGLFEQFLQPGRSHAWL